jgi:hypothetical protein
LSGYTEGPTGVGGWLGFFVVALGLLSPGAGLVQMLGLYSDPAIASGFGTSWPLVQVVEWSLFALSVAGAWYLVWRLLNVQTRRTVHVVIAGIWLISVGGTLVEFGFVALGTGVAIGDLAAFGGSELVRPIIFCIVWTAYLLVSKRVANTYQDDPAVDSLADVFK